MKTLKLIAFFALWVVMMFYAVLIYMENVWNGIDSTSLTGLNATNGPITLVVLPLVLASLLIASGKEDKSTYYLGIATSAVLIGEILWFFAV